MIDKIKDNWKTILVGLITASFILWGVVGCDCTTKCETAKPVQEEPKQELSDEEIEKLF